MCLFLISTHPTLAVWNVNFKHVATMAKSSHLFRNLTLQSNWINLICIDHYTDHGFCVPMQSFMQGITGTRSSNINNAQSIMIVYNIMIWLFCNLLFAATRFITLSQRNNVHFHMLSLVYLPPALSLDVKYMHFI